MDSLISRLQTNARPALRLKQLAWDPLAQSFWSSRFGENVSTVAWTTFLEALGTVVALTPEDRATMRKILDHNSAGYVTIHTYTQFLHGHGPLGQCVKKLNAYTTQPWFHWYLDHDESTILMKHSPARTFVVRFSKSNPGSFALTIKLENGLSEKWLVESNEGKLRASFAQNDLPSFDTITDFVQHYKQQGFVKTPLVQPWTSAAWFLGLADGPETIRVLEGQPIGTYLLRLSSNGDYLVCAYVLPQGIVQEKVLWPAPTRFVVENWEGTREFRCESVTDFIKARPHILITPFAGAE